jgi:hypothetical protein
MLYLAPKESEAVNCGLEVPEEIFNELEKMGEVDGLDIRAYLPPDMMELCNTLCESIEITEPQPADFPWVKEYMALQ